MENVTWRLSEFIAKLTYDQISAEAVSKVKSCLLDSLGCALLGAGTKWGKIVNGFVQNQSGTPEARLWATKFLGPAANVVLGNGTLIHSFDFDDYHMTKIHPGSVVIPAALAIGEKEHADGKMFVAALANGDLQGYITTKGAKGYEASLSLFSPTAGAVLVDAALSLMGQEGRDGC